MRARESLRRERPGAVRVLADCREAVERFLPGYCNLRPEGEGRPRLWIDCGETPIPVRQLSDGERGVLALVLDLTRRLAQANPELDAPTLEAEAVVLIDEIDLHLHPRWQRQIVHNLTSAFPRCQFIATTHSPQVIGEVDPDRIQIIAARAGLFAFALLWNRFEPCVGRDHGGGSACQGGATMFLTEISQGDRRTAIQTRPRAVCGSSSSQLGEGDPEVTRLQHPAGLRRGAGMRGDSLRAREPASLTAHRLRALLRLRQLRRQGCTPARTRRPSSAESVATAWGGSARAPATHEDRALALSGAVIRRAEELDYRNLLGACLGGDGQPPAHLQHCDTCKGDRDLSVESGGSGPLTSRRAFVTSRTGAIQVQRRILSASPARGSAESQPPVSQEQPEGNSRRHPLIGGDSEKATASRSCSAGARFQKERDSAASTATGELDPYCQVAVWWLDQRLGEDILMSRGASLQKPLGDLFLGARVGRHSARAPPTLRIRVRPCSARYEADLRDGDRGPPAGSRIRTSPARDLRPRAGDLSRNRPCFHPRDPAEGVVEA